LDLLVAQALYREFAEVNRLAVHPSEIERHAESMETSANPAVRQSIALLDDDEVQSLVRDSLIREKVMKYLGDQATSAPPSMEELQEFAAQAKPTTAPMQLNRASHIVF